MMTSLKESYGSEMQSFVIAKGNTCYVDFLLQIEKFEFENVQLAVSLHLVRGLYWPLRK